MADWHRTERTWAGVGFGIGLNGLDGLGLVVFGIGLNGLDGLVLVLVLASDDRTLGLWAERTGRTWAGGVWHRTGRTWAGGFWMIEYEASIMTI